MLQNYEKSHFFSYNRGIRRFHPMYLRIFETSIFKKLLKLFWWIGGHAIHEVKPF